MIQPKFTDLQKSMRKPHNNQAGYICELKNRRTNIGHVIIYFAKEQGLDDTCGKYAVVCSAHNTIVNTTSLSLARSAMKAVDFCQECMEGETLC